MFSKSGMVFEKKDLNNFQLGVKSNLGLRGFALVRSVNALENLRHSLNQSDAKLRPVTP